MPSPHAHPIDVVSPSHDALRTNLARLPAPLAFIIAASSASLTILAPKGLEDLDIGEAHSKLPLLPSRNMCFTLPFSCNSVMTGLVNMWDSRR